ncbi:LacI family DNA-binding transcriptional regulator [Flammeovirga agarivorans]|uniref:LacI family transcriptional regulator n=1 Tax=Flammeovirga agarivorans TaxID=2726742 RepID=A0A7X8SNR2_9BACT|nr:LacI family DNA-binding transcriptional regulator [Flammeovirga agarivorans]NLR93621.1 LacI family transcriptional regulator [Flammeovirga agarivorans]
MKKSRKTTIKDLAKALEMNVSTVSRALNDHPKINIKTKERVRQLAKQMDYIPNPLAQGLQRQSTRTIGVIFPTFDTNFFFRVLKGVEKVMHENNYQIIISTAGNSKEQEKEACKSLSAYHVDGIIIFLSYQHEDPSFLIDIQDEGIPLLFMDRIYEEIDANYVVSDDFTGMFETVCDFIDQGKKKIIHIQGSNSVSTSFNRTLGYQEALREKGIEENPDFIIHCDHESEVKSALRRFFSKYTFEEIDLITCFNDYFAFQALEYLKENNIKIPDDISLLGFANEPLSIYTSPKLSTINQPAEEMGEKASELLLDEIEHNKKGESYAYDTTRVKTFYLRREST